MRAFRIAALLLVAGCVSNVDPDQGHFSCTTQADCGDGYECIAQATTSGGSRCFKKGTCVAEKCNGLDDNCNGLVDETFTGIDTGCNDGGLGVCAMGLLKCVDAGVICSSTLSPATEVCNGLDDNCNGSVDEPFDLATDNFNCGVCSKTCGAGTACKASHCRETNCADGIDNDDAGGADCLDPACFQGFCFGAPDASYSCGRLPVPDAGPADAGADGGTDGGVPDAGELDAGELDAGDFDAGFDAGELDAGEPDAGLDAGPPDAGPVDAGPVDAGPSLFCFPPEDCADGLDNDMDGLVDCADPQCNGRTCFSGTACSNGVCPGPG
jgi:hypothetical protein